LSAALSGIKILDLSRILAGPWASQLLADYGAEVIKVEQPGSGDDTRQWGPPWMPDAGGAGHEAAYFHAANRNKRSITVDLSAERGQRLLRELVRESDVLIENFRAGSLRRYGLDAGSLLELNEGLVYCSISAYGQTGAKAADPGYDAMVQATAGLMSITGRADDEGGEPRKVGVAISDIMAGMYAATAILAALEARRRSGRGQHIDVPLYDTQVAWLANQGMNYLATGESPRRMGNAHPNIVPYETFATADGYLMLAVGNERQFRALAECLECPEVADAEAFSSNAARVRNRRELVDVLAARLRERTTAEWTDLLYRHRIPAGPINDLAEVFTNRHAEERQLVRRMPRADGGEVPTIANPVRFSDTPVRYELAPPTLGQHTNEVLGELGYTASDIDSLREAGVI
jgi:crotonobetainyl-CoA:carnitine CoA-transferase CaiB-like acyl-CoA transferase